jgi:hypothetical protein
MRTIAEADGSVRLWYDTDEIERIAMEALRGAGLWALDSGRAVDIEHLLEIHLGAAVDYGAPLEPTVLGYTAFASPPRVSINRALTDAAQRPGAGWATVGRWRATLAHEAAHILLHARLFQAPKDAADETQRCLRTEVGARQASDWREVQANIGMGSLLLPGPGVVDAVRAMLVAERVIPPVPAASPVGYRLIGELTRRFAVSRQVARIRLIGMGFLTNSDAE